jgi:hypothetical protein
MIEILAASDRSFHQRGLRWAAMGVGKRNDEARDAVIRLTACRRAHRLAARGNAQRHKRRPPGNLHPP